jgi:hypothetical protein
MIAVWGCLLCLLADLLDRFDRRFAVDVWWYEELPARWLAWGLMGERATVGERRYFFLRLPSWSYEYSPVHDDDLWCQRAVLWVAGRGWRFPQLAHFRVTQ